MEFNYKYGGSSSVQGNAKSTNMSFAPDTLREPTFFVGSLGKHINFREAMSALHDVVVPDMRFNSKDKTEYLEWAKKQEDIWLSEYLTEKVGEKQDVDNKIATVREQLKLTRSEQSKVMGPFNSAKRKYFDYLYQKDKDAWFVLDPVITVHPDEIFFECFSQDESTYGKLGCNYNVFKKINEFECGTTNIDYSDALYNEFQKIRNYKETEFKVDPSGFEVATENEDIYKEVKIDLPDSWVRGFLQVSSAMTLDTGVTFDLNPMDVYNICLYLRRYKEKHGPRSLKYILKPGKPISVILEPWNYEIKCPRSIYTGPEEREIRVWGRRRILILERLLPVVNKFTVTLLGTGLPSIYVADLGDMNFTLGLSGWSANDWSRAGNFDLMAPRMEVDSITKETVFNALKENWVESVDSLSARLGLGTDVVSGALSAYTQAGRAIYDMKLKKYRVRELTREPLPMDALRFANPVEEKATKLVENRKVSISAEQNAGILKITGTVTDNYKSFLPSISIDQDQRIVAGSCSCNHYNMNQLRKGPCEHILSLRMKFNKDNH